jgi:hypothetical protein
MSMFHRPVAPAATFNANTFGSQAWWNSSPSGSGTIAPGAIVPPRSAWLT